MPLVHELKAAILVGILLFVVASLRLLYILPSVRKTCPAPRKRGAPTRLLIVLGSGGHTAEMFAILSKLDTASYTHRSYVVSEGDNFSAQKAIEFEDHLSARLTKLEARSPSQSPSARPPEQKNRQAPGKSPSLNYDITIIPRARRIHQSLWSTPISAVKCLLACFSVLRSPSWTALNSADKEMVAAKATYTYPDLVLTNGPGTAVCVVLACLLLKCVGARGTQNKLRTIYVESWARVRGLSLSGKILVRLVDRFLVQWEALKGVGGGRGEYLGVLV
ncbi:glycosyltransferase family 1 protein [Xylona heveae TC161]|uniref:UDP-N-acetylglucosamine transferase subunit ALG14 n=1 Tax=Xylona heveae (strain CBS 132557 / TC161) TaxID=1328760 RepID=A0A165J5E7_XYLHT|nr:glycosyltransferase family 1 protein [Xylona heveae TC161]KZF25753.1 glycosyltransferase family 1 protein [Xylona heveae TC161]